MQRCSSFQGNVLVTAVQYQSCEGLSKKGLFDAVHASPDFKVKFSLAAHDLDLPGGLLSTNWNLHEQPWSATVQLWRSQQKLEQLKFFLHRCFRAHDAKSPWHSIVSQVPAHHVGVCCSGQAWSSSCSAASAAWHGQPHANQQRWPAHVRVCEIGQTLPLPLQPVLDSSDLCLCSGEGLLQLPALLHQLLPALLLHFALQGSVSALAKKTRGPA